MTDSERFYQVMIHFAVATLHFYRKDIVPLNEGETLDVFVEKNRDVLTRVFDEGLMLYNYEMSRNQIQTAVRAYTATALSVRDTKIGGKSATD